MSNKSYKVKNRFYVILFLVAALVLGVIFKEDITKAVVKIGELGKEKKIENFNSDSTQNERYFVFTSDSGYAVYSDKMIVKFYKGVKFNKDKDFYLMLKSKNYREIINFYNFNVPEKIVTYYLAENVTDDFDSSSINVPAIDVGGTKYMDSRMLSEIFIYRFYEIDYKKGNEGNGISADILNATEKERYNGETVRKLRKAGYRCIEANYGESLNGSIIIGNKATSDELKKFVLTVNERYIKTESENPFATSSDIVFIAGSDKNSSYEIKISGKKKNEGYRILDALGYSKLIKTDDSRDNNKNYIRCNAKDYYTAYKISKILKIDTISLEEIDENKIEIVLN